MKFPFSRFFVPIHRAALPCRIFSFFRCLTFVVAATLLIAQSVSAQVVDIPDPNLEKAIRETLDLPDGTPITQQNMLELVNVSAWGAGITDLTGLEHATYLQVASFVGNQIQDLQPLARLVHLETVALERNPVADLSPLANLTNLDTLRLSGDGQISDITPLINLRRLETLKLANQAISDISPLVNLTNLIRLHLEGNQIHDITLLANLTLLEELLLDRNAITDITPLIGLKNLKILRLADNPIEDFTPLIALGDVELDIEIDLSQLSLLDLIVTVPDTNLKQAIREALTLTEEEPLTRRQMLRLVELDAQNRGIADLTGIEYAIELQQLLLCENQIYNLRPLASLVRLDTLTLRDNQLTDISPLAELTALRLLDLKNNMIEDVRPLVKLSLLEELGLERNRITNINPLTLLKALKILRLADNPIQDFTPLVAFSGVELDVEVDTSNFDPLDLVVEILDPNLRGAVRETLELPEGTPITRRKMLQLEHLSAWNRGIIDLTGLEHATYLRIASLVRNQIQDIRPLAGLIQLETVALEHNPVSDISPLVNLTNLKSLRLAGNQRISDISWLANFTQLEELTLVNLAISDIRPLATLTNLTYLNIAVNDIIDYSPLANLINLQKLWINQNPGTDFISLQGLNLTEFYYDEVCEIPPLLPLVRERIGNRSFPSVFQLGRTIGLDHLTWDQTVILHDLNWNPNFESIDWDTTQTESTVGLATSLAGDLSRAREVRQRRLDQNPNIIFIRGLELHVVNHDHYAPDSDLWLRDTNGEIIRKDNGHPFIDFLKPEVQALTVKRIIGMDRCGLYDGVFFDGFGSDGTGFVGRSFVPYTDEEITQAALNVLPEARKHVREDFLILVNAIALKPILFAEYINGSFLEVGRDHPFGYTRPWLRQIESALSWDDENLREPRINCLEGSGMSIEPPDGPNNLRWMRVFTTMSLTHSDGYVLYTDGREDLGSGDHDHLWYDFWDAELGYPVGPKNQLYGEVEGLFIREFTNGWAVYNRSRQTQTIALPTSTTPVSDRGNNSPSLTHILPDLDGEIYLKTPNPADVNGDGRLNVLDLVQVANGLGKSTPDPNGDGVVNILDLVFVAQQFSQ